MKYKSARRRKMQRRFNEESQKIHDECPESARSGLVQYQLWLRIMREENPEAEALFVKTKL